MGKLSKRELEIIIEDVYRKVSIPSIEKNKKLIDDYVIPGNNQYVNHYNECKRLYEERSKIDEKIDKLEKIYHRVETGHFKFPSDYAVFSTDTFNRYKESLIDKSLFSKVYYREDIEREIILAGNKDIPELIEVIINKLK